MSTYSEGKATDNNNLILDCHGQLEIVRIFVKFIFVTYVLSTIIAINFLEGDSEYRSKEQWDYVEAITAEKWISLLGEVTGGGEFNELFIIEEGQLPPDG